MRVANITCSFADGDGIGNACRARTRGLLAAGHEVLVVSPRIEAWSNSEPRLSCIESARGWLQNTVHLPPPAVQQLHSSDLLIVDFGSYSALHKLTLQVACPLLLYYHGLTPSELIDDRVYTSGYLRSIGELRQIAPDLVVGASNFILREYRMLTGNVDCPSKVIPLFGQTRARQSSEIRPIDGIDLLCVGRIYPNKNLELIIEAMRILRSRNVQAKLRIVGSGLDPITKRYLTRLKSLAKGLTDCVEFLGKVSANELERCYARCSAVVIPSLHEGFSLPAVEAIMHGKPVFASRLGALPETLADAAIFFDPFDARALANQIVEYGQKCSEFEPKYAERASRRAAELTEAKFIENSLAAVEELLAKDRKSMAFDAVSEETAAFSDEAQLVLVSSQTHGSRLYGELIARRCSDDFQQRFTLRAIVINSGMVTLVAPPACATWTRAGKDWRIRFAIKLAEAGDWSEIVLTMFDKVTKQPTGAINPCWMKSSACNDDTVTQIPQSSLAYLARKSFDSADIASTSELGWAYRLKSAIANPILALVYNLLISPQLAFIGSVVARLETRSNSKP